ncbi:kinase-like protein [Xylona heveae TC161]|uniref:Kinase-like protein n=1 Tax=Xylona heveae (strain CBS 132557 / TC161) TaxID=1328760 RepID=A0A165HSM2_XYLHT|nr:kinase-like protein [Xylona heveae TC161]KZF23883.1 kinase-like protein [Xylona heveae TC161]
MSAFLRNYMQLWRWPQPLQCVLRGPSAVFHRIKLALWLLSEKWVNETKPQQTGIPDETTAARTLPYDSVIQSRGTLISGGGAGIVERLPSGAVIKSPWTDERREDCRAELRLEWQIYQRLGAHPGLVKILDWNDEDCTLTMELMENGQLDDYIRAHNERISSEQRDNWVKQAAEVVAHFHSLGVIHCDLETRNCLLDAHLRLKLIDFAGSSVDGSRPSAFVAPAFLAPDVEVNSKPTIQHDLFSLGSLIYNIVTGHQPFEGESSRKIQQHYKTNNFPNLENLQYGEIIHRCWHEGFTCAQEIVDILANKRS